jgi:hypothetical protein
MTSTHVLTAPDTAPDTTPDRTADTTAPDRPIRLGILPWHDPVVDARGYAPRSDYVETFWLGTLGPTATWLLRRLDAGFDEHPEGYELDLADTARSLGLGFSPHPSNPFTKAITRCTIFGLAQFVGEALAVRRRVPPLPQRHLQRLPAPLQAAHVLWERPGGPITRAAAAAPPR